MLEKFKDFRDTMSDRIKSPFVGSLILTWTAMHWKIYLYLFYPENDITIQNRIDNISDYVIENGQSYLVWLPIAITLLVLLCYQVLNAVGLGIRLLYDNWASPYIQKLLYNKNIVDTKKHEKLKKEHFALKNDYQKEKDQYLENDRALKDITSRLVDYQKSSLELVPIANPTTIFGSNKRWINQHKYKDGTKGREVFVVNAEGFSLLNAKKIEVTDIKSTRQGEIVIFDKIIDGKPMHNFLLRDPDGNYIGTENANIKIKYYISPNNIEVVSAKYGIENNYNEVTDLIQSYADLGKFEFAVTNEELGGDPAFHKEKALTITYVSNGEMYSETISEYVIFKFKKAPNKTN